MAFRPSSRQGYPGEGLYEDPQDFSIADQYPPSQHHITPPASQIQSYLPSRAQQQRPNTAVTTMNAVGILGGTSAGYAQGTAATYGRGNIGAVSSPPGYQHTSEQHRRRSANLSAGGIGTGYASIPSSASSSPASAGMSQPYSISMPPPSSTASSATMGGAATSSSMATSTTSTSSVSNRNTTKAEQILQNFYSKVAQVIVQARLTHRQGRDSQQHQQHQHKRASAPPLVRRTSSRDVVYQYQTSVPPPKKTNKWFNLELEDIEPLKEELKYWRTQAIASNSPSSSSPTIPGQQHHQQHVTPTHTPPPLIIDLLLDISDLNPETQSLILKDELSQRRQRIGWQDQLSFADTEGRIGKKNTILLETWQLTLSFVRLLPAYQLFKRLKRTESGNGNVGSGLKIGYRLSTSRVMPPDEAGLDQLHSSGDMRRGISEYSFGTVDTPFGVFSLHMTYRLECDFSVNDSGAFLSSRFADLDEHYFAPPGSLPKSASHRYPEQQAQLSSTSAGAAAGPNSVSHSKAAMSTERSPPATSVISNNSSALASSSATQSPANVNPRPSATVPVQQNQSRTRAGSASSHHRHHHHHRHSASFSSAGSGAGVSPDVHHFRIGSLGSNPALGIIGGSPVLGFTPAGDNNVVVPAPTSSSVEHSSPSISTKPELIRSGSSSSLNKSSPTSPTTAGMRQQRRQSFGMYRSGDSQRRLSWQAQSQAAQTYHPHHLLIQQQYTGAPSSLSPTSPNSASLGAGMVSGQARGGDGAIAVNRFASTPNSVGSAATTARSTPSDTQGFFLQQRVFENEPPPFSVFDVEEESGGGEGIETGGDRRLSDDGGRTGGSKHSGTKFGRSSAGGARGSRGSLEHIGNHAVISEERHAEEEGEEGDGIFGIEIGGLPFDYLRRSSSSEKQAQIADDLSPNSAARRKQTTRIPTTLASPTTSSHSSSNYDSQTHLDQQQSHSRSSTSNDHPDHDEANYMRRPSFTFPTPNAIPIPIPGGVGGGASYSTTPIFTPVTSQINAHMVEYSASPPPLVALNNENLQSSVGASAVASDPVPPASSSTAVPKAPDFPTPDTAAEIAEFIRSVDTQRRLSFLRSPALGNRLTSGDDSFLLSGGSGGGRFDASRVEPGAEPGTRTSALSNAVRGQTGVNGAGAEGGVGEAGQQGQQVEATPRIGRRNSFLSGSSFTAGYGDVSMTASIRKKHSKQQLALARFQNLKESNASFSESLMQMAASQIQTGEQQFGRQPMPFVAEGGAGAATTTTSMAPTMMDGGLGGTGMQNAMGTTMPGSVRRPSASFDPPPPATFDVGLVGLGVQMARSGHQSHHAGFDRPVLDDQRGLGNVIDPGGVRDNSLVDRTGPSRVGQDLDIIASHHDLDHDMHYEPQHHQHHQHQHQHDSAGTSEDDDDEELLFNMSRLDMGDSQ
ncbi:autophagy protein 13 [Quaeritorhiza haematococci]|nr:autophagy protein 13 [Quaeritorhiza haematococci]